MKCGHQGFHTFTSSYDRGTKILIYFSCCDDCGARLTEVSRLVYEPRFDPHGNDRFLSIADPSRKDARDATTRRVTLRFGEFGWRSLESEAGRDGQTLDELLGLAIAHLDAELRMNAAPRTTRGAVIAPRFKPGGHGTPREVRLELAPARVRRLGREARRQGIPLERLLEHAPLFYLADHEASRVLDPPPDGGRAHLAG